MLPATVSSSEWADATFGHVDLGDVRRTARLVGSAAAIAQHPASSLPGQLADPAALKGLYRLLDADAVRFDAILAPHQTQTRAAATGATVLLVQDTTTLDFTHHPAMSGLGPLARQGGQGLLLHTMLAVSPEDRLPLGVLAADPFVRQPAPAGETDTARTRRPRESDIWGQLVTRVGTPPADSTWVHVADRGADCASFFAAVQQTGADVLVRVAQNRRITLADGTPGKLLDTIRARPPAADRRHLAVPARGHQPARTATVAVSWQAITLEPPTRGAGDLAPMPLWAVRVWEPDPPDAGEPVEWVVLTSVPVVTLTDAWTRVAWYTARWVIEELHKGLKTGCGIEQVRLQERARLERLLAMVLPVAVRLLRLRGQSRQQPLAPVGQVADAGLVALVARLTRQPPADTVARFAAQVARLGGYQDRRGDGPPGWQTLWRGWQRVADAQQTLDLLGRDAPA